MYVYAVEEARAGGGQMGLCAFVVGCIQDLSRMLGQARDLSWGLAA